MLNGQNMNIIMQSFKTEWLLPKSVTLSDFAIETSNRTFYILLSFANYKSVMTKFANLANSFVFCESMPKGLCDKKLSNVANQSVKQERKQKM